LLHIAACTGEKCKYYKKASSQDRTEARLCSLDEETQESIAKKYYGGFRPWKEKTEPHGDRIEERMERSS